MVKAKGIFYWGFKGALFHHWAFWPVSRTVLISANSSGLVQPLIALRLRATTALDMLDILDALRSMLSWFVRRLVSHAQCENRLRIIITKAIIKTTMDGVTSNQKITREILERGLET